MTFKTALSDFKDKSRDDERLINASACSHNFFLVHRTFGDAANKKTCWCDQSPHFAVKPITFTKRGEYFLIRGATSMFFCWTSCCSKIYCVIKLPKSRCKHDDFQKPLSLMVFLSIHSHDIRLRKSTAASAQELLIYGLTLRLIIWLVNYPNWITRVGLIDDRLRAAWTDERLGTKHQIAW